MDTSGKVVRKSRETTRVGAVHRTAASCARSRSSSRQKIGFADVADGPATRRPSHILGIDGLIDVFLTVIQASRALRHSTIAERVAKLT
jgi:hypothetical protein